MSVVLGLGAGWALAGAAGISNEVPLLTVSHSCGELHYVVAAASVSPEEIRTLRNLLSYLYDGARAMVTVPGEPKPQQHASTRKWMLESPSVRQQYKLDALQGEALDAELRRIHASDPHGWHLHEGLPPGEVSKGVRNPAFLKRGGSQTIPLLEERIEGNKAGRRRALIDLLKRGFGVEVKGAIVGDENCHVMGDLEKDWLPALLADRGGVTLAVIGQAMGLPKERVREIEGRLLRKIGRARAAK